MLNMLVDVRSFCKGSKLAFMQVERGVNIFSPERLSEDNFRNLRESDVSAIVRFHV